MLDRTQLPGHEGLYGVHKYWGKKPADVVRHLIMLLSVENDHVVDPFVGSGAIARESIQLRRRFTGIDINPSAIRLTDLVTNPPASEMLKAAFARIESKAKERIYDSYQMSDQRTSATHYLWENDSIISVWSNGKGRSRIENAPTLHDTSKANEYKHYKSSTIRQLQFFNNSRINTKSEMTLADILSGRAQRNIDLLLEAIGQESGSIRKALEMCLTSSIGQMSKMVFAITGRGKTSGQKSSKIEVGSWVIGYWRPTVHFEVNAWNCFERRTKKLLRAILTSETSGQQEYASSRDALTLINSDAAEALSQLTADSVDLIITDPPHGDRIPYLELSELWNAVLGEKVDFENEIVVSNAKSRGKSLSDFKLRLAKVFDECGRVTKPGGWFVLLFNSRDPEAWELIRSSLGETALQFVGRFEAHYSAGSVVQDNRTGALQYDFALVFQKPENPQKKISKHLTRLRQLPNWNTSWPA